MDKLSERIETIIKTLTEKVSSMEETASDCANYTTLIGELYALFNAVKRMETVSPDNYAYFEKTGLFVLKIERVLYQQLKETESTQTGSGASSIAGSID